MLCYVLNYLDRVNVGFAKLQMADDLQFSDTVYGLGPVCSLSATFPGNSQQPDTASSWRKVVDCADHDHLGDYLCLYGICDDADVILCDAILTRGC